MNPKNTNLPLSLALIFIILFSLFTSENTAPTIPILGFHGIISSQANDAKFLQGTLHYPTQQLEPLLEDLILHNYWFLSTQDLYDFFVKKSKKIPEEHLNQKPIMISFDDGHKTVHTNLLPILYKLENKYNKKVKVVLFINPGTLAKPGSSNSTHIGCQELREGLKKGFYDIQSHGLTHKNLTQLSRQELVNELLQSQVILRECTKDLDPDKKVASHFAYPYGAYNQYVISYVSRYYLSSYLYNHQLLNYGCKTNDYEIPRLTVSRYTSFLEVIRRSEGFYFMKKNAKTPGC